MIYNNPTYTFENLSPGQHAMRVTISDQKHNAIPGEEKILSFEVLVAPPGG